MPTDILFFIYKILDVVLCYYKPFFISNGFFFTTTYEQVFRMNPSMMFILVSEH